MLGGYIKDYLKNRSILDMDRTVPKKMEIDVKKQIKSQSKVELTST